MKNCITLIGMPACGKSTIGVVLAKRLGKKFTDSDLLIQEKTGRLLRQLIEENGDAGFRLIEDRVNSGIRTENAVIAPGGSVIYGKNAMRNLKKISMVIYLKVSYQTLTRRLKNLHERGVSIKAGQTLKDLYEERIPYYEKYADITVDETGKSTQQIVDEICRIIGE
jgi:shikimate kinase